MGRMKFLQWAAAQGWKHGQRYLQKAYNHFYDKGKLPDPKVILQKAKSFYDNFTGFAPKVIKPKQLDKNFIRISKDQIDDIERSIANKPKLKVEKSKQIIEGMKPKGPKVVNIGDRIIKQMQKEGKTVKFDDLVRIYGKKKPPTLKADGGSIDKALPKRSRDI